MSCAKKSIVDMSGENITSFGKAALVWAKNRGLNIDQMVPFGSTWQFVDGPSTRSHAEHLNQTNHSGVPLEWSATCGDLFQFRL